MEVGSCKHEEQQCASSSKQKVCAVVLEDKRLLKGLFLVM